MIFAVVLVATAAFCLLFKNAIRKAPVFLYLIAGVLSLLFALTGTLSYPFWLQSLLFVLMQKGTLACALFVVVMYMGPFKDVGFVKHRLMPIRATLSIVACLLILGHVAKYLIGYLGRLGSVGSIVLAGLIVGIVCLIIMLPLGITSFNTVKRAMTPAHWIALQKAAYVFYGLVYVHLALLLLPSSMQAAGTGAGEAASASLAVYTVAFGLYAVLRIGKAVRDRQEVRRGTLGSKATAEDADAGDVEADAALC